MNKKLHTPYGVRDYLPRECYVKREIESRIENVFQSFGYKTVKSPMFEYIEVFDGKGSLNEKQMYKFIDRDGRILALRPDNTPAIARIAATNYKHAEMPLKLCYLSNVFRYNESYQGKYREFTQAGIELIGVNNDEANAEVLAVAIKSLLSAGLKNFKIDVGHVKFLKAVLNGTGLENKQKRKIQNYIIEKNYVAVRELILNEFMPEGIKALILNLPMYLGGIDVLRKAKALTDNTEAHKALESLEAIYEKLKTYGLEGYTRFDLSAFGHFNYYTGIIFSGYANEAGFSIIDGGRYDKLIDEYGAAFPSIGFSININELLSLKELQNNTTYRNTDLLIGFSEKGRQAAVKAADELREKGFIVETSVYVEDIENNERYALNKGIKQFIYFQDENSAVLTKLPGEALNWNI